MTQPGEMSGDRVLPTGRELDELDLLLSPEPTFDLIEPAAAPLEMLERVGISADGLSLESVTDTGVPVSVELYWAADQAEPPEERPAFHPPLATGQEDVRAPEAAQEHPYVLLPDGALYQIVVRAPREPALGEAVEEKINLTDGVKGYFGMSLDEFAQHFPGVDVNLPTGNYLITATKRTTNKLFITTRVENGEPLIRHQRADKDEVHYKEVVNGFAPSVRQPDTAVSGTDSRLTIRGNGEDADRQRLVFRLHEDGEGGWGTAASHSGRVEVMVMEGEQTEITDFVFTQPEQIVISDEVERTPRSIGASMLRDIDAGVPTRRVFSGSTSYLPPRTVKARLSGVGSLKPVAAFRFALAGAED